MGSDFLNSKIKSATLWSSVTEVMSKLISPIVNMILARLLVPEQFGIIATINMVISFAEVFTDAGFQKYIVQHEFESEEDLEKSTNVAFWTNLMFSALACGIIFVFRHNIAQMVGNAELGNAISLGSIAILIAAFSSIQFARYKRDFDFKTLFFVRIGTSIIPLIITVPLAIILRDYRALLIGTLSTQIFSAVVLTWKSKWKPKFFYDVGLLKKMFSFTFWTLIESISIWFTSYIDVFVVGNILSSNYLGIYKTAITTVNSYMSIVAAAITPVLFSALSRCQNKEDEFKKTYFYFQKMAAMLIVPMGVGIWVFRDFVTDILLGSQWKEASMLVGLWGITSSFAIVFSTFSSEAFRSKGQPKVSMLLQCIHLIFLIPTLLISSHYGFEILCIARSFIRLQIICTAVVTLCILYKFKFADFVKNIGPSIVPSIIMMGVGYCLKGILDNFLWNLFSIVVCVLVYGATLALLFPKTWKEIIKMGNIKK